jgi:hypothetical protein
MEGVEDAMCGIVLKALRKCVDEIGDEELVVQVTKKAMRAVVRNQQQIKVRVNDRMVPVVKARMQEILNEEFLCSMSYYDTTEAFYHGVLLTLMQLNGDYFCESNRESGNGRFDVMARRKVRQDLAFILEVKVSSVTEEMVSDAEKAAAQIEEKKYFMTLQQLRYRRIMTYGIAFSRKTCVICQGKTAGA